MTQISRYILFALMVPLAAAVGTMTGCARGEEQPDAQQPNVLLNIMVEFAAPVDDQSYYYIAFDADDDFGDDYPVPIANGPFWANGWATGSMTHFIKYHFGSYEFYQAELTGVLRQKGGVVDDVAGTPDGGDTGQYSITVRNIDYGQVTVSGTGMIQNAVNETGQNAGTIQLETDASGNIVADSVQFSPADVGGSEPTRDQQQQLDDLSTGDAPLRADSFSQFGIALTLSAPDAGTQSLQIEATTAPVTVDFVPTAAGTSAQHHATITANHTTDPENDIVSGVEITTGRLDSGAEIIIDTQISQQSILIGPPYAYTQPSTTNRLQVRVDMEKFGDDVSNLSLNIISTTDLIFDPNITDPDRNCYDALGPKGNDAISFSTEEFRTYTNADAFVHEQAGDDTLTGPVSQGQKEAVDIVNWTVSVERL